MWQRSYPQCKAAPEKKQHRKVALRVVVLRLLPRGMIVLVRQAGTIAVNRAAEEILGAHDGLLIVGHQLAADLPSKSRPLQNLIAKVIQTAWLTASILSEAMLISRRCAAALQVLVVPAIDFRIDRGRPAAIDPQKQMRPSPDVVKSLFGLTPAERRCPVKLNWCGCFSKWRRYRSAEATDKA